MDTIYCHMNATQRGANLHPGVNLPPGANCAHEYGFSGHLMLKSCSLSLTYVLFAIRIFVILAISQSGNWLGCHCALFTSMSSERSSFE